MLKTKALLQRTIAGDEPSDEDQLEALTEVLDVVSSIADSLARLAAAAEDRVTRDPSLLMKPTNGVVDTGAN